MAEMMNEIRNWLLKIFKKKTLLLPSETNIKQTDIKDEDTLKIKFKDNLRTVASEEEKVLIKKFENGEITFIDITEEVLDKICKGYSLEIDRNMNVIQNNIEKIKRKTAEQN